MVFVVSERCRFLVWTIGILLLWQLIWVQSANVDDNNKNNNEEQNAASLGALNVEQQTHICHALCGHCGCMAFYCGEECICECNEPHSHGHNKSEPMANNTATECLGIMQNNARALQLPFQLLIQGPDANRIVRTALHFQQPQQLDASADMALRDKRATVVIYTPTATNNNNNQNEPAPDTVTLQRQRRGVVDHLEWFNDLTNGLVRPAPIRGSRKTQSTSTSTSGSTLNDEKPKKRAPKEQKERYWFENDDDFRRIKSLTKPAPMMKRQRSSSSSSSSSLKDKRSNTYNGGRKRSSSNRLSDSPDYDSNRSEIIEETLAQALVETPLKVMEKFPQALKDVMRRIRMKAAARKKEAQQQRQQKDGADEEAEHSAQEEPDTEDNNNDNVSELDNFDEMFADLRKHLLSVMGVPTVKPELPNLPTNAPGQLPYYRHERFLKRVQDAIDNAAK